MLIHGQPQILVNRAPKGFGPLAEAETRAALGLAREADKFGWKIARDLDNRPDDVIIADLGYRAMIELSLRLKSTRELFWHVKKLRAGSLGEVSRAMNKVPWIDILPAKTKCAIQANSVNSLAYNENLIKRVAGEDLAKLGFKITEKEDANQTIDLSLVKNQLTISVSLSGKPLRFRGYKLSFISLASIREDLAGCITESCLNFVKTKAPDLTFDHVFAPFSGSGTLGFEAAIALRNIPLFAFRNKFAALDFPSTPEATRGSITRNLLSVVSNKPLSIQMIEVDREQFDACQQNIEKFAGLSKVAGADCTVSIKCADFFEETSTAEKEAPLFIPLNPPYGDRIGTEAKVFYKKLADRLNSIKNEIGGFCLAPDADSVKAFVTGMRNAETQSYEVDHGGRMITVINFWRRRG